MDFLECISSANLTQQKQLHEIKEIFESDVWRECLNDAIKELAKRKETNAALRQLYNDVCKAIRLLWQDPLISFARDIHYNEYLKDLMDDDKKLATELRRWKIKKFLKLMLLPVGILLGVFGIMFSIVRAQSVIGCIAFLSGCFMISAKVQLLADENCNSQSYDLKRLRDAASAMALVKETEQYKAILELEDFAQKIEHEMELCSWPPI